MSGLDEQKVVMVPLKDMIPDPFELRSHYNEDVIKDLTSSIAQRGIKVPLLLRPKGEKYEILDGNYRYYAAKRRKLTHAPTLIEDIVDEEALDIAIISNWQREEFTYLTKIRSVEKLSQHFPDDVICIKLGIEKETLREYKSHSEAICEKAKQTLSPRTQTQTRRHARALRRLRDYPEKQVEFAETIVAENLSGPAAEKEAKKQLSEILHPPQEPGPLPEGEYNLIYADPPWPYRVKHLRGNPEKYYPSMATDEICELEIPSAQDAVLFLWTTNAHLEDALKVMHAWGFQYKTNIAWVKDKFGTGFYVRGQHELLLIGTKGEIHPPEQPNRPPSVLSGQVREHSQKPEEAYAIIEQMYPHFRFLELFARNGREGWESWGNEV